MSVARSERVVVIKELSADLTGKKVGWSEISPISRFGHIIAGSMAVASVAEDGARYSYTEIGGRAPFMDDNSVVGFERTVQLNFTADRTQNPNNYHNPNMSTVNGPSMPRHDDYRHLTDNFAGFLELDRQPTVAEGRWSLGSHEILETLREQLEALDALWIYPALYYHLAMAAAEQDLLIDPTMRDITEVEYANHVAVLSGLDKARREDQIMAKNLTVFGAMPPSQVSDVFTQSRREVAQLERTIRKSSQRAYLGRWHAGPGAAGRGWPYMDPLAEGEEAAFGLELDKLRNADPAPAASEIEREIKELGFRSTAMQGLTARIDLLRKKEAQAFMAI